MKKRIISAAVCAVMLANASTFTADFDLFADAVDYELYINEICAKNTTHASQDGNCYDWIEIYNAGSQSVDLSGFGLSDKETELYRYTFPSGTSINAGGRLIVYCDSSAVFTSDELLAAFGLSTDGETVYLTDASGVSVDTLTFGIMEADVTYGRFPDGSATLYKMQPTPLSANIASQAEIDIPEPVFSAESGFYSSSINLTISSPQSGLTVYYTTDGSDPDTSSSKYSSSIYVGQNYNGNVYSAKTNIGFDVDAPTSSVDKCTIVRAICVDANGNCSDIVTKTYFAQYNANNYYYDNMTVVSLVTDPDNLFDETNGIYVLGKVYENWKNSSDYDPNAKTWNIPANYTQSGREWERPATMQIFENGQYTFSQDVGIRIHGGATRSNPQKSFNVYARSDYGTAKMEYAFYDDNYSEYDGTLIDEYDSIMLRNAANDIHSVLYRDSLIQSICEDRAFLNQAAKPCTVFIDGEYWGFYYITEKLSDDYIKSHYGIKKSDVAMIKNHDLEEGEQQDLDDFLADVDFVTDNDMSVDENYQYFCDSFDVQSFIDYMCVNMYISNEDWPLNNMAVWRSNTIDESNPYSDGKWRMIMFDTEYSTGLYGSTDSNYDSFAHLKNSLGRNGLASMLLSLLENDDFREQFSLTYMDIANVEFNNSTVQTLIDERESALSQYIYDTWERFFPNWLVGSYAQRYRTEELSNFRAYFEGRFNSSMTQLKNNANISTTLKNVNIKANASEGAVKLNTSHPDISSGSWTGQYYYDYPLTFVAEPAQNQTFSHWKITNGELVDGYVPTDLTIKLSFNSGLTVEAVYGEHESTIFGDSNLNFCVDDKDFAALNAYLLGEEKFNENQYSLTDMDGDDTRNAVDLLIQKRSAVYGTEIDSTQSGNDSFDPSQYTNLCSMNWSAYGVSGDSAYSFSALSNGFKISLSQTGSNSWAVQGRNKNTFSMTQGKTYYIVFDVYSTVDRTISSSIQNNSSYDVYYTTGHIGVEANTPITVCKEFVMDQTSSECYFNVNLGAFDEDSNLGTHTVTIDNVYVVCVD